MSGISIGKRAKSGECSAQRLLSRPVWFKFLMVIKNQGLLSPLLESATVIEVAFATTTTTTTSKLASKSMALLSKIETRHEREIISEHAMVRLLRALTEMGLAEGARGAVVHVHENGEAYEVEFSDEKGDLCVVTVTAAELERV